MPKHTSDFESSLTFFIVCGSCCRLNVLLSPTDGLFDCFLFQQIIYIKSEI